MLFFWVAIALLVLGAIFMAFQKSVASKRQAAWVRAGELTGLQYVEGSGWAPLPSLQGKIDGIDISVTNTGRTPEEKARDASGKHSMISTFFDFQFGASSGHPLTLESSPDGYLTKDRVTIVTAIHDELIMAQVSTTRFSGRAPKVIEDGPALAESINNFASYARLLDARSAEEAARDESGQLESDVPAETPALETSSGATQQVVIADLFGTERSTVEVRAFAEGRYGHKTVEWTGQVDSVNEPFTDQDDPEAQRAVKILLGTVVDGPAAGDEVHALVRFAGNVKLAADQQVAFQGMFVGVDPDQRSVHIDDATIVT